MKLKYAHRPPTVVYSAQDNILAVIESWSDGGYAVRLEEVGIEIPGLFNIPTVLLLEGKYVGTNFTYVGEL